MAGFDQNVWRGFMFDVETGGVERSRTYDGFAPTAVQDFLNATESPGFRESGYYLSTIDRKTGLPYQLLEFFADNGFLDSFGDPSWEGFHPADGLFLSPQEGFAVSSFSRDHGIHQRSVQQGIRKPGGFVTEEDAARAFYGSLEGHIARDGQAEIIAWNGLFDLNQWESITHRYDSLKEYRGWFARKTREGVFRFRSAEDELFRLAWKFGEENPEFAQANFLQKDTGRLAKCWEELRSVPGWSVEGAADAFGGKSQWFPKNALHSAAGDVPAERALYQRFLEANTRIQDEGLNVQDALRASGLISEEETAEKAFTRLFSTPWARRASSEAEAGSRILSRIQSTAETVGSPGLVKPLLIIGAAAAAGVAAGLAFGKRRDRQTTFAAFSEEGEAARNRHAITDFGSGWRGLSDDSQNDGAFYKLTGATAGYSAYRYLHGNLPGFASTFWSAARNLERKTPGQMLSTLGISKYASQYLPQELEITRNQIGVLRQSGFELGDMGAHLQRLIGDRTDLTGLNWADESLRLKFLRTDASSPYLRMHIQDSAGLTATDHWVSFTQKGTLTGSSARYGAPLYESAADFSKPTGENPLEFVQDWFRRQRENTRIGPYRTSLTYSHGGEELLFQPFMARTEGEFFRNTWNKLGRTAFNYSERMNRLLGSVGLGIRAGSYNSTASLVGQILTRRVLPIWAGITAAGYLDYLTDHKASNFIWGLRPKAKIAHAEATDTTPGWRSATDFYNRHLGDRPYAPLALPLLGATTAGLFHFAEVVGGKQFASHEARQAAFRSKRLIGVVAGAALMIPFLPGMLGSKETAQESRDIYSGKKPVAIRSGRWWDMGNTLFRGGRILMYRPDEYVLHKSRAEDISIYGSEKEKWDHNPLISPLKWFNDPYWLESRHAKDRPYPVASPAFSNVPLVGPILAATVGKVIKPPKRLKQEEWDGKDYVLYNNRIEPNSPRALAPVKPTDEFGLKAVAEKQAQMYSEMIGLPGFLGRTLWSKLKRQDPNEPEPVHYQGSRQMKSLSRRYYERELGALYGPTPEGEFTGFSEPLRRFIQRDDEQQANELKNDQPSWMPGPEYFTNFHKGDPFASIPMGFALLPGVGYEALHPELKGVDPENYPDIVKLRILADTAPFSGKFRQIASVVGKQAADDSSLRAEYEDILRRTREMQESSIETSDRHTGPTDKIEGTVKSADSSGIELEELPGRKFGFSSVGMSAAHLSARAIGDSNRETAGTLDNRLAQQASFLSRELAPGRKVNLVVPKDAADSKFSKAVVFSGNRNINREMVDTGLAGWDLDGAGAESQYMESPHSRLLMKYGEAMSFSGDEAWYNPLRYLPKPLHTKLWNRRTPLERYLNEEVYGSRFRRWQNPIKDIVVPWVHGAAYKLTGRVITPERVDRARDFDTLTDQLQYLRELQGTYTDPENRGVHAMRLSRTSVGSNVFGEPDRLPFTLSGRDRKYFSRFLNVKDEEERGRILASVSRQMAGALRAQWTRDAADIARAEGRPAPRLGSGGKLIRQEDVDRLTTFRGTVTKVLDGNQVEVKTSGGVRGVRLAGVGEVSKETTSRLALGKEVAGHESGPGDAQLFLPGNNLLNYELINATSGKEGLNTGDFFRSREIAEFFSRRGLKLPGEDAEIMAPDIDYEDVKLKIIQWEGLDSHDFGIYEDRVNSLWRKPYLDGAVRELTSGDDRNVEQMQATVERMIAASKAGDPKASSRIISRPGLKDRRNVRITVETKPDKQMKKEVRRNPDDYRD